jgi:hypothetical protein
MTQRLTPRFVVLMAVIALAIPGVAAASDCLPVTVCFTPGGNCTQLIVQALGEAKRTVPIAKALLDAHKRGVFGEDRPASPRARAIKDLAPKLSRLP